jgi:predicted GNAT superfamily acetyltransferase
MGHENIEIRTLLTYGEMLETEELHRKVWKYPEPTSAKLLLTISETGGHVSGAYIKGALIGFAYALLAKDANGLYLRSQSLIVLKEYRDRGVGLLLRTAQRKYAKGMGIAKMEWTFDPLQTRLGNFYIKKLGAIIRKYSPDLYDRPDTGSYKRVTRDRFYAEWHLDSQRVVSRIEKKSASGTAPEPDILKENLINNVALNDGIPEMFDYKLDMEEENLLLEIPGSIEDILNHPDILSKWRSNTRKILDAYINRKQYTVIDFLTLKEGGTRRNFYFLSNQSEKEWLI